MKMMKEKKKLVLAVLVLASIGIVAGFQFRKAKSGVGERPSSQLIDKESKPVDFEVFAGKVVVINNWASWCPPCVAEMPSIQKLKQELKSEDIVFVMVSFDEDPVKAKSFMKKRGYDLEVYFPGKNYQYATSSIPVTFILDREGNVVLRHEGMLDFSRSEFVRELRKLLE